MYTLKTDFKRAFTGWGFVAGICGLCIAAFFGVFEQILPVFQGQMAEGLPQGFTIELVFAALRSDVVLLVMPILCALPFTPAFLDDFKSRYLRSYLPRSGKQPYVRAKVVTTALSGGLALVLGILLTLLVFSLLFLPMEVPPEQPQMSEYEQQMLEWYGGGEEEAASGMQMHVIPLVEKLTGFFLCGCMWSLVGGLLATITMSKYMAYASPFILYYVLVILSQRYFKDVYVINPQEWLNPGEMWVGGAWGAALLVGEVMVILGFVYAAVMRRKIEEV